MRKTLLSMIFAAATGCASLALAANGDAGMIGHGWHGHGGAMAMHHALFDKLDLSDAQRDQIRQIMQQSVQQMKPQMETLHRQREAFESMTPGSAGYQTAAANLAQAEADVARAHVLQHAALRAQVYNLLTPAQRSQLSALQAQHQAREQQWEQFQAQHPLPASGS